MKKMFSVVGQILASLFFGVLLAVLMLEWWAGCGETYVNAKGERIAHECIFIGSWVGK